MCSTRIEFRDFFLCVPYVDAFQLVPKMLTSIIIPDLTTLRTTTGVQFEDSDHYRLGDPVVPYPIVDRDLISAGVPSPKIRMSFPGLAGAMEPLGEAFLAAGLYSDALNALRLRLSGLLLVGAECHSHSHRAAVAVATYQLALAQYMR